MNHATTMPHLLDQLIDVGAVATNRGLVLASGGNLSARLPGADEFVLTGAGTWLDRLKPDDFSTMNLRGEVCSGNPTPSTEWKLHQRTYLERADVHAVIHLHPQHTVLVDALGYPIRLFTLDHATYVRSIGRTEYYPNGSDELADRAAAQAREHNCVVMAHHGCSALGADISMAFRRAMNLEEAAIATFRALCLGDTDTRFPPAAAEDIHHS